MNKGKQPNTRPAEAAVRMTTAEAAVGALIAHGIDTIYALPGVHNDCLFDALFKARDRIRMVHTRHEQGAAYLALGAALATGKPQVYSVVPGPGLLNSAAALLTAYGMNAPVRPYWNVQSMFGAAAHPYPRPRRSRPRRRNRSTRMRSLMLPDAWPPPNAR
jgi:hypothetical protein